jgi:anti-sigma factor RsiW
MGAERVYPDVRVPSQDSRELAELAALADGSLSPERRAALEARVAASSELANRLAEQERALTLTRTASAEVEAPVQRAEEIAGGRRPEQGRVGAAWRAALPIAAGASGRA